MTCADSAEIYFDFQTDLGDSYLKLRPRSMQFDRTRGDFDYCQAEFSDDVAKHIRPYIEQETSFLRQPLPVVVILNGEPVYRLLWVPDGVTFSEDSVHIEFHDPQKYLTRGVVDWRRDNVKLKEAYRHVFENRNTNGATVFNDIKFTVPEQAYDGLIGHHDEVLNFDFSELQISSIINKAKSNGGSIKKAEEENVYNIIEGNSAIDFDKISPWECITRLNKKFGVTTWAAPDGNLWVGSRNATGVGHIATPDDRRVWKLSDYNATSPRDPVVKSIIRGPWSADPSESWAEQGSEILALNRGTKDFRVEAVASNGGNEILGQEIFEERIDAKKDNLEEIAKRKMINKQREQQSGYIEIRPELSGEMQSQVEHAQIGDSILTIPPDDDSHEDSACDTNIELEIFDIVGVQHELTGDGQWNLRLDIVKQLDGALNPANIETRLRYYNPHSKETITEDQYSVGITDDFKYLNE